MGLFHHGELYGLEGPRDSGPHEEEVRRERLERMAHALKYFVYFCHFENERKRVGGPYVVPCQEDIQHLPTRGGTNEVI